MSWETTDVLAADTADVIAANTTDGLAADTTPCLLLQKHSMSLFHTEDVSAPHRAALWSCSSTRAALQFRNSRICGVARAETLETMENPEMSANGPRWVEMG